jgi:hypothetical protein
LPDASWGVPLPARICQITRKALAVDPQDRYQSVLELKRDVELFLQGGIAFPTETFAAGERIVTEGEMADTAYVIVQGTCVAYNKRNGTRSNVRQLGTGSVFGEETVFHPGPCSATVEAVTDVSVRLVTRKMLDEGLGRDAWFGALSWRWPTGLRGQTPRRAALQIRTAKPRQPKVDRAWTFQSQWTSCRVLISFRLVLFTSFPFCHGLPFGEPGRSG